MAAAKNAERILVYLLRRDLRLSDNPVFHEITKLYNKPESERRFTHVLPIYVYAAQQLEVSGFIPGTPDEWEPGKSPYPEARSGVAGFWRCGPHRAKWIAESVWDLKTTLEARGSSLIIRAGLLDDVVRDAFDFFERDGEAPDASQKGSASRASKTEIVGVWMTDDECVEERREERGIRQLCEKRGKEFRLLQSEQYYIDDRDLPYQKPSQLPNVFTEYRKSIEPLRERPRKPFPAPAKLPPLPSAVNIPPQSKPFEIPDTLDEHINRLQKPLADLGLSRPPEMPTTWATEADAGTQSELSGYPFKGGETTGHARVEHLIVSSAMSKYKETRNGLVGMDYSTKLSGWLAMGCISARQVHYLMAEYESGEGSLEGLTLAKDESAERKQRLARWKSIPGFGKGENKGTAAVRFELLWRDYFRLYAQKFGSKLFHLEGVKEDPSKEWTGLGECAKGQTAEEKRKEQERIRKLLDRFRSGRTGIGLVDASQRELYLTGYTSNRARQNVASFLSKHLDVDWRIGAEWYECMLIDYETANNWGNWQYVAGVGNDPRQDRQFNPVKQALDYDPKGEYIRTWVQELRDIEVEKENGGTDDSKLIGVFQAWRLPAAEKERLGLKGVDWVEDPLKRIDFTLGRRPRHGQDARGGRRGGRQGRGGRGGRWRGDSNASSGGGGRGSRGSSQRGHSPHPGQT